MIEMLIVVSILSVLLLIAIPVLNKSRIFNVEFVINDIAFQQFEAIMTNQKTIYEEYNTYITFNREGGVNHADTYDIEGTDIIVTLGTGRIYIHEQQGDDPD